MNLTEHPGLVSHNADVFGAQPPVAREYFIYEMRQVAESAAELSMGNDSTDSEAIAQRETPNTELGAQR